MATSTNQVAKEKEEETGPSVGQRSSSSSGDNLYLERYVAPFWPALLLAFPILPVFLFYHVRVTKDMISFGYLVSKRVDRSSMKTVEPIEHIRGLKDYGGWGIRFRRGAIAYICKNGPGIKLTVIQGGNDQVYVFNCAEPKTVCDLLLKNDVSSSNM